MCKQKTQQQQTSSTTNTLSDWSRNLFETGMTDIMGTIDRYNTDNPYQPYTGQMVADLSDNEQRAREYANTNLGSNAGLFSEAGDAIRRGMTSEWNPEQVSSTDVAGPNQVSYRTFDADRIRERQNPYEQDVVDAAGAYFDESRDRELMNNQARATQSGAFGGSRHGVADAELMRTSAMDRSGMLADLRYRGWNDNVAADERESAGIFSADTFNATGDYNARRDNAVRSDDATRFNAGRNDTAAQWRADNQFRGAGALSDLATTQQNSWMQEAQFMNQLGMDEREIENARLLAERAQWDEQAADEYRRFQIELQTRIGLLGAVPLITNSTGTGTSTGSTSGVNFAQVGGLLSGVGGMADWFR